MHWNWFSVSFEVYWPDKSRGQALKSIFIQVLENFWQNLVWHLFTNYQNPITFCQRTRKKGSQNSGFPYSSQSVIQDRNFISAEIYSRTYWRKGHLLDFVAVVVSNLAFLQQILFPPFLLGRRFPPYSSRDPDSLSRPLGRRSLGPGAFTLMEVTTTQGRVRPCQRHQE